MPDRGKGDAADTSLAGTRDRYGHPDVPWDHFVVPRDRPAVNQRHVAGPRSSGESPGHAEHAFGYLAGPSLRGRESTPVGAQTEPPS